MDNQRALRLFGFPVMIRPGFLMFLLLVVALYGGTLGLWTAGALAVFTLVHELGHAFCARAFGCTARISLDFLAGYASFIPPRPLKAMERVAIAIAGPATQFVLGIVVLAAMGVSPISRVDIVSSDAATAIWWAGVALAVINLFPAIPLDGGLVLAGILEALVGERGYIIAMRLSLVLTLGTTVLCAFTDNGRQFLPFLVLLVFIQLRTGRTVQVTAPGEARVKIAEVADQIEATNTDAVIQIAVAYLTSGAPDAAVNWALSNYRQYPHPQYALAIAEGLAQSGNQHGAMQWIERAIHECHDLHALKHMLLELPAIAQMARGNEVQSAFLRELEHRRS